MKASGHDACDFRPVCPHPLPRGQRLCHCTVIAPCMSQVHDGLRRENVPCVTGDVVRDSEKRAEMET